MAKNEFFINKKHSHISFSQLKSGCGLGLEQKTLYGLYHSVLNLSEICAQNFPKF